ncbi:MAG TPA: hypothetical protein VGI34_04480 [Candidatus Acidoferrales bacterium]
MHCIFARLYGNLIRMLIMAASGTLRKKLEAGTQNRRIALCRAGLLLLCCALPAFAAPANLKPDAAQGYARYLQLTEERMKPELAPGGTFLLVDGLPEVQRKDAYARLGRGEVVVTRLRTHDSTGSARTPDAMIHHWVGTIFISGATLGQVLALLQDYDRHTEYFSPEVVKSKIVAHTGDDFKVYYRLMQKKIITVVLDTDYDVHYHRIDPARAFSDSHATRIAEVEHHDEPGERQMTPGNDGGFLWRLDSYWRFMDGGDGVYVQCEAVSLTRDIPSGLNWLIGPFVESIPKESLEFTLQSTRIAVTRAGLKMSSSSNQNPQ